jgi:hypothetical protein
VRYLSPLRPSLSSQLSSQTRRIGFLDLPTEILDAIWTEARNDTLGYYPAAWRHSNHLLPACQALLRVHRARYRRLILPAGVDPQHLRQLFPHLRRLHTLYLHNPHELPSLLPLLPQPSRLVQLNISSSSTPAFLYGGTRRILPSIDPSPTPDLPAALWGLTSLEILTLNCDYDLADPFFHAALRRMPLRRLYFGQAMRGTLKIDDLRPLVVGPTRHPDLETRYDTWEMPKWYDGFRREDLEKLISEASEVSIEGTAVEALELEDRYEEIRLEVEEEEQRYAGYTAGRIRRMQDVRRWNEDDPDWESGEEEEEY